MIRSVTIACILALGAPALMASGIETPPARHHKSTHHPGADLRLAIDVVRLKSGTTLRGAIVHSAADGSLTMAVSREWLRKTNVGLFTKWTSAEATVRKTALEELRDRLNREIGRVPEDSRLGAFFRSERKRVERLLGDANPLETQFVWIDLKKRELARVVPASPSSRRVAGWSWSERLPNVETRNAADLEEQLRQRGLNPVQQLPDLSDRFPIRRQDEQEWAARLALVEYAFAKPLDFQGTGDRLVRVGRGANPQAAAALMPQLLGDQVDAMLKDLLGGGRAIVAGSGASDAWFKTAYPEAISQNARAFRATRVNFDLTARQASVDSVFVVRLKNGDWKVVWSDRETEDASKERPATETAIAEDPQVKSALASLKALGNAAADQVKQAIRFGAATMQAQQAVDRRFYAFETPYLQHLDGPPLW